MARYRLTADAEHDLDQIYRYSIENFGLPRARGYMHGLDDSFALIADNRHLGRDYSRVKAGIRRHEHKSHSIHYRVSGNEVLILRVLGSARDPARHL